MFTHIKDELKHNELLTVKEVATYLRVSRVTVWRWCQQGVIPASQVGRNWRIHRKDLLHLLKTSHGLELSAVDLSAEADSSNGQG